MAASFGCDPVVAGQISGELAEIRGTLTTLGKAFDGLRGVTGSAEVEKALDHFVSRSSDSRKKMDGLLERASSLLRGLADGTSQVDAGLYTTLVQAEPAGTARLSPQVGAPASTAADGAR